MTQITDLQRANTQGIRKRTTQSTMKEYSLESSNSEDSDFLVEAELPLNSFQDADFVVENEKPVGFTRGSVAAFDFELKNKFEESD